MSDYIQLPDGQFVEVPKNPSPEFVAAIQKTTGLEGVAREGGRVLDQTLRGGASALPGMMGDAALLAGRNRDKLPWTPMTASTKLLGHIPGMADAVDSTKWGDVRKMISTLGGAAPEIAEPQTRAGKVVGNIGESAVGAMTGGGAANLAQRGAIGTGAGVGGEAAAFPFDDGKSPGTAAIMRFLGSLVGGGAVAGKQAYRPNAKELIQQDTKHMTHDDWRKAERLEQQLDTDQMPHLKSQLLGPRSTLTDSALLASGSPGARGKMVTAVEGAGKRAEEVATLRGVEQLAPAGQPRLGELGQVQEKASAYIAGLKGKANEEFTKHMPSETLTYPVQKTEALYNRLVGLANSPTYGPTGPQGKVILAFAERLKNPNYMDDIAAAADPMAANKFLTNGHQINNLIKGENLKDLGEAGMSGKTAMDIKKLVQSFTREFDAARAVKSDFMTTKVNPVEKSLIGQIAKMGGGPQDNKITVSEGMLDRVFNKGSPSEITDLGNRLGPEIVSNLLREHISRTMERVWKASPDTARVEDTVQTPAKLVNALYGSEAARKNIDAALVMAARANSQNPSAVKKGFNEFLQGMESYKDLRLMGASSARQTEQIAGQSLAAGATAPVSTGRSFFRGKATEQTYNQIADYITNPKGLKLLEAIAREPAPERKRAMLIGIVTEVENSYPPEGK